MPSAARPSLIAVDIGNSRVKLGLFSDLGKNGLPQPVSTLAVDGWNAAKVTAWLRATGLGEGDAIAWRLSSVNRPVEAEVVAWLGDRPPWTCEPMIAERLPLAIAVAEPSRVGMDRLANAIAANRIRASDRPAIVIDLGSAITVDLISAAGAFLGGAILPGIAMSARALHDFTDLLPLIPMSELDEPPPALGAATIPAMRSGLYWGAVGAMRELIARLGAARPTPQVYLTGGAAPAVTRLLTVDAATDGGSPAEYVAHLTLGGIALADPPHASHASRPRSDDETA